MENSKGKKWVIAKHPIDLKSRNVNRKNKFSCEVGVISENQGPEVDQNGHYPNKHHK